MELKREMLNLHTSYAAQTIEPNPGFGSIKQKNYCYSPALNGKLVHLSGYLPVLSAGPHLYSWVKRDTVTLKNLASEHTSITWPELEPRPPDLEFSAQKTRPKSYTKSKLAVTYV